MDRITQSKRGADMLQKLRKRIAGSLLVLIGRAWACRPRFTGKRQAIANAGENYIEATLTGFSDIVGVRFHKGGQVINKLVMGSDWHAPVGRTGFKVELDVRTHVDVEAKLDTQESSLTLTFVDAAGASDKTVTIATVDWVDFEVDTTKSDTEPAVFVLKGEATI